MSTGQYTHRVWRSVQDDANPENNEAQDGQHSGDRDADTKRRVFG